MIEEVVVTGRNDRMKRIRNRKGIKDFWGKFKDGIIDLFKEEEDHALIVTVNWQIGNFNQFH